MQGWLGSATAVGQIAKLTALGFGALVAAGGVVEAAGGATWLAIVFAAVGVVGALVALALGVLQVRTERREARDALWCEPPRRVADLVAGDGMYVLGAETEAPEALEAADLGDRGHAPYIDRGIDDVLRDRLTAAAGRDGVTLILLSGASKAGKSRTLLEALGTAVPHAWLIQPTDAAAVATLASARPPRELQKGPCVVWLDDVEPFVRSRDGLNRRTLRNAFETWKRPVLVVGAQGGKGRQDAASGEYADPLHELLRAHQPLELAPWLTGDERRLLDANPAYSQRAAQRIAREGVGEFMIVATDLREKLSDTTDCPEGLAVARAAIDWQRLGLVRPVPAATLRELYRPYLPGPEVPGRFERGIEWATAWIHSHVAVLLGQDPYEPYDYAVRYERERERPIPDVTWDALIERHASDEELSSVGIEAMKVGQVERAEAAFRRADEHGDLDGAFNLGVLLRQYGKLDGADAAYRRADERGHPYAASNLGNLLWARGNLEGAEATYRRADERGQPHAAHNLGVLLERRGDLDGAEAAYRRADDRGDSNAASNLGVLLERRGELDGAEAAYRRAEERGENLGASNLGLLLTRRGDLDGAEAAFRRADELGGGGASL